MKLFEIIPMDKVHNNTPFFNSFVLGSFVILEKSVFEYVIVCHSFFVYCRHVCYFRFTKTRDFKYTALYHLKKRG